MKNSFDIKVSVSKEGIAVTSEIPIPFGVMFNWDTIYGNGAFYGLSKELMSRLNEYIIDSIHEVDDDSETWEEINRIMNEEN